VSLLRSVVRLPVPQPVATAAQFEIDFKFVYPLQLAHNQYLPPGDAANPCASGYGRKCRMFRQRRHSGVALSPWSNLSSEVALLCAGWVGFACLSCQDPWSHPIAFCGEAQYLFRPVKAESVPCSAPAAAAAAPVTSICIPGSPESRPSHLWRKRSCFSSVERSCARACQCTSFKFAWTCSV
jgi:hypothetical protein